MLLSNKCPVYLYDVKIGAEVNLLTDYLVEMGKRRLMGVIL